MTQPDALQDQMAKLRAELQAATDMVSVKQIELQAALDVRQALRDQIADIRAAYVAWKGTQP
jgi:chromosome segregation ATPase